MYLVEPYGPEASQWLAESGVDVPPGKPKPGRNPTPAEIREVCDALDGFKTEYKSSAAKKWWQATIAATKGRDSDRWTVLNIDQWGGSESRRYKIVFDKGDPTLILQIVHGLSKKCGPLLVVPDSDEPVVVWPEADLKKLARRWG
jgi:hypothetical protein